MYIHGIEHLQDIQPEAAETNQRRALHELLREWIEELRQRAIFQRGNPGVNFYLDMDE